MRSAWRLDPEITFLNHGSYGACPRAVLAEQTRLREELEKEPVRFFAVSAGAPDFEARLDEARAALARLLGAQAEDVAFVPNATTGISTVLASQRLQPGDELLTTDHAYNACRNALDRLAERTGAHVKVVTLPFPVRDESEIVEAVLAGAGPRTRLALLDHVTSPTAIILPIAHLCAALQARGIDVLVDGAHAPGMLPLDLDALGAAYYTGNCHKWLCAPKGSAFLHVRRDRQAGVRPLVVSHGANSPRRDRSRFLLELDWTGTADPTPYLCVPAAIRFLEGLLPGGLPALQARNHELALASRRLLAGALGVPLPCPDSMIGSMASLALPERLAPGLAAEPLMHEIYRRFAIEVFTGCWPPPSGRVVRVSAQAYNTIEEVERLAGALDHLTDPI